MCTVGLSLVGCWVGRAAVHVALRHVAVPAAGRGAGDDRGAVLQGRIVPVRCGEKQTKAQMIKQSDDNKQRWTLSEVQIRSLEIKLSLTLVRFATQLVEELCYLLLSTGVGATMCSILDLDRVLLIISLNCGMKTNLKLPCSLKTNIPVGAPLDQQIQTSLRPPSPRGGCFWLKRGAAPWRSRGRSRTGGTARWRRT